MGEGEKALSKKNPKKIGFRGGDLGEKLRFLGEFLGFLKENLGIFRRGIVGKIPNFSQKFFPKIKFYGEILMKNFGIYDFFFFFYF